MTNHRSHSWSVAPTQAKRIQERLREKVQITPLERSVKYAGGADISFDKGSNRLFAGITVLQLPELKEVAYSLLVAETNFPYVPGLLSFRESPPLLGAWHQLQKKPDVLIMDGHGIAHFRRMGIATHFGVLVDIPTIGCAKNKLVGTYQMPGRQKGDIASLLDKGEKIGTVLRTRTGVQPVFVSPGHRVDFEDTVRIVLECTTKYKLPETTRRAHHLVNRLRKGEIKPGIFSSH